MKRFLFTICILTASLCCMAQTEVRFSNEASDTLKLTQLLDEGAAMHFDNPEARVAFLPASLLALHMSPILLSMIPRPSR